ncbi:hypothetical protein K2173_016534 [Erythroxylum novogranatense]|uniref:F-box domain-containing protein n=1 Tax=Erythroxylum novogranatense TaxID=1862640 RepID=A0AAV8SRY1_9ROSI|nr:hypothetical protein K2173_016534 [Erythroxylum novogranatense]
MLDQLPEEVTVEILLKVPVKFLVRCTCVCKSWFNLITDTTFISTHLTITKNLPSNQFLLTHIHSSEESACVLHFKENGFKNYMRHDLSPRLQIKGSCSGLICLVDDAHTFSLWNPSIKASLTLPKSKITTKICEPCQEFFGFGFELHTNDYKVLHIVRLMHGREPYVGSGLNSIEAELYSLNAGTWKRISCVPHHTRLYSCPSLPFVNGFLHCIASQTESEDHDCRNVVWAFDVNRETSRNILLPEDLTLSKPCKLSVSVHGESSIAVLDRKGRSYSLANMGYENICSEGIMDEAVVYSCRIRYFKGFGNPNKWGTCVEKGWRRYSFVRPTEQKNQVWENIKKELGAS